MPFIKSKFMKRLFLLLTVAFTVFSCSLDDDNSPQYFTEFLPIDSVEIPDEFQLGEIYEIKLNYMRPNNCYRFYDFYFASEDNQRTVAIRDTFYEDANCSEEPVEAEVSFNFEVRYTGTYVFRFWQGQDDSGTDNYYIVEVPVVE